MKILKTCVLFLLISAIATINAAEIEQKDSIILLNEVVIGSYQVNTRLQKVPGSITLLEKKDINISDGNNFNTALHSVPGIYMHSGTYGTSRIVIRGVGSRTPYNTNRIKSYLNDIPITSSDGISTPEDIELMNINRIEIVKGPASTLYGSGLGGNVNMYTSNENIKSLSALMQYGSFNTLKAGLNGNFGKGNFNASGNINHLQSNGYRENNDFRRTSLLTTGQWSQSSHSIAYTLILMDVNAGIPSSIGKTTYENSPQSAAANWKAIEGFKKVQKGISGVTLSNSLSSAWSNRLTAFGKWIDSYEKRPFNNLDDGTTSFGLRNRVNFHSEKWDVAAGFEFVNDTYKWLLDKNDALINKNSENRNQLNIFGLAYFRPNEKWNISAGASLSKVNYKLTDQFPENGDQSGTRNFPVIFSPRVGVNYAPNHQIAFYASAGHGFSMPSPEETLLPEGDINKDIRPEQGIQTEIAVRMNLFGGKTLLDAAVYQINLTNLLVTKRLTEDIFTGINAGKTRHRGIELMLKQQIFASGIFPGNLIMNANYTLSDNSFIEFTDNDIIYNGKKLPGIPSSVAQAGLNWEPIDDLLIQSQFLLVGSQYLNDANTGTSDGYFTIQLKSSYQISIPKLGEIEIFNGINNLTDARYASMISVNALSVGGNEPRYYYPGLPRHFYGGIKYFFN